MKVSLINMQHGECVVFTEGKTFLMVDCGSQGPGMVQSLANAKTQQAVLDSSTTRAAVVSHFHQDHFNVFKDAFPTHPFSEIYIPNVGFCAGRYWAHPGRVRLAVLEAVVEDIRSSTQGASRLIDFLEWVIGHIGHAAVYAVMRGNDFYIGEVHARAYWPDGEDDGASQEVFEKLCAFLQIRDDVIGLINRICQQLASVFSVDEGFDGSAADESPSPVRLVLSIDHVQANSVIARIRNDFNELKECLLGSSILGRKLTRVEAQRLRRIIEKARNGQDETSLVMALSNDADRVVLMTGDAPNKTLQMICRDDIRGEAFDMFKAPHHGTKSHYAFYGECIDIDSIAICNGAKTSNCGPVHWEYLADAPFIGGGIVCTNCEPDRCDWLDGHRVSPACCGKCPVFANAYVGVMPVF